MRRDASALGFPTPQFDLEENAEEVQLMMLSSVNTVI